VESGKNPSEILVVMLKNRLLPGQIQLNGFGFDLKDKLLSGNRISIDMA
jgi:hypothetical protein